MWNHVHFDWLLIIFGSPDTIRRHNAVSDIRFLCGDWNARHQFGELLFDP